ncbi:hypothetical protein FRB90_012419 [Tulasnella sp. 427]|nr:hypothetical protein FRB90_012419 [Tulasnella sp. 427]
MSEEAETSISDATHEIEASQQLPNPTEPPPATSSSSSAAPDAGYHMAMSTTGGPMLNPYLPPGVVPYYRQVGGSGSVALPSNSTTTVDGTTPPTAPTLAVHPTQQHNQTFPASLAAMPVFPPYYNPYSFMQNQHTYQQQYHAAALAFNPHAAPYGPAGGVQVGMYPHYGVGYPYGFVDPMRRQAFPPVPTTSVSSAASTPTTEKKKQQPTSEPSSSSQPKTIPGLASLTSPSYYPSPPDINEARRNGSGRKIIPVTRDVPEDLAEQRPDDLFEEVDVLDSSAAGASVAAAGDQMNIADPGSYPWATTVSGPSTFHGVPLTTKYKCKICDHIFPKKHTVVTHIKTHLGKKSYPCTHEGCTMAFVREHDRKRHQATHTGERSHICECGKQFSRQDALRRHAQYGRCPNRGPVTSLANVKVGSFTESAEEDLNLKDADEAAVAKALEAGTIVDGPADGESQVPGLPANDEEDQLAGDDGAASAQAGKEPATGRLRRSQPAKKDKPEQPAPKPKITRKKRKRSSFARPVDDGDSELDEDDDEFAEPPPPPAPTRKAKKLRKSPQVKAPQPAAAVETPEEEDELLESYEEEDPNHAPSSFQFALPGVHSKEDVKVTQATRRVQPRRGRGAVVETEIDSAVVTVSSMGGMDSQAEVSYEHASIHHPSFTSTSEDSTTGDKYASILERMHRTPFSIEAEVMKSSFPLGLVRNVDGQGAASEALQRQQADQDVTMSDWVQDQESDADMSEENERAAELGTLPTPAPQEPVGEASSDAEEDGPEEEDVATVLGVGRASVKEAVAAS